MARRWTRSVCLTLAALLGTAASAGAAVQYRTTSDWGTGFNGQITLVNDTGAALSGWTLEFDWDRNISGIWNATILSKVGTRYTIKAAGWNAQLAAGAAVSFGFGASPGNVKTGPTNFKLNGVAAPTTPPPTTPPPTTPPPTTPPPTTPRPTTPPAGITVAVTQTSAWTGGFGANLAITNGGSTVVNGWKLSFTFNQSITSLWNGHFTAQGGSYTVTNESWNPVIAPGTTVTLGFNGNGALSTSSASNCVFNGVACAIHTTAGTTPPAAGPSSLVIGGVDSAGPALSFAVAQGSGSYPLSLSSGSAGAFEVATNNSTVVSASVSGSYLVLTGLKAGRAGLKLRDTVSGSVRYVGVRVRNADGSLPGLPNYLALGSVSEDTTDHLAFWQAFSAGPTNKRLDIRYIYLNGGPINGWDTWGGTRGSRAVSYIRNSRQLGIIPFFVFYNIPDAGESYYTNNQHIQSSSYMQGYFKNLKLALDIINQESKDDVVGMILEPDFIGYLAQNANQSAASITAMTNAAYSSGVLKAGADPLFADNVQGLVKAINYTISKYAPQVYFGWQMNLWASPAGGWTTSIPATGIVHKTDTIGVAAGRPLVYQEAAAITRYYLEAGVASYGANFLSIDKYGLDATGYEASAASDPANSTWFWNNDHWQNYLQFVRAMRDTSRLPVVLWQLPVGHINGSTKINPYSSAQSFPNLVNSNRMLEDSTSTFFFGDTFQSSGARFAYFSTNGGNDPSLRVSGSSVTWGPHFQDAAAAGVTIAMFGAGVGASTTNVGNPPTDSYWWITAAQVYYASPVIP